MMYRHPFVASTLLTIPFCVAGVMPIVGPVVVAMMIAMRFYWTLLADPATKSGLFQYVFFFLTAPLSLAGSLIASSFFTDALIHFGFQPWSYLIQLESWWAGIAIPMARSIFVAITQAHDSLNALLGVSSRWLPDGWWLPGILSSDPARATWIVLPALASLLVLMIAFWDHLCIRFGYQAQVHAQMEAEKKLADFNAAVHARVASEIKTAQVRTSGPVGQRERHKSRETPKMGNGLPSALEF